MKQVVSYQLEEIRTDCNIRTELGTEDELRGLGLDMKQNGQQMPCLLDPDGVLMDGYRRLRAAQLVGLPKLDCIKWHKKLEGWEIKQFQLASVLHRKDVSSYDKAVAARDIKAANPGMTNKQLAEEVFHIDASGLTRLMAVWLCVQEVQDAFKDGKLTIADVYAISQSPDQLATLQLKLGGASVAKVKASAKKSSTVTVEKMTLHHQSGAVVKIAGDDLSLDSTVELLNDLVRQIKKASSQGLDSKTFQSVLKDMAAAG